MSLFKTLSGLFQTGSKTSQTKPTHKPKKVKSPAKVHPGAAVVSKAELEEAKAKAQEILVEAKDEARQIKRQAEEEIRQLQNQFSQRQSAIARKEAEAAKVHASIKSKQKVLRQLEQKLEKDKNSVHKELQAYRQKLKQVAQMSKDEAREVIFNTVEKRLRNDIEEHIKAAEHKAQQEANNRAREIIIDALKHGANEYVAEYTVSIVKLPSDESKGRIIGKEGRNIRAFEKATGVDIDLDETPGEVRLSSFDPIRREVARVSLTRLVSDGRIQPTRIEEYVQKARKEIDKITFDEGKKLANSVGVYNLPKEFFELLGQFKYHFTEGQNLLSRTLEQVKIGVALAEEIGANVDTVRLGCLLHDIGRVIYDEEGRHIDLAINRLRRYNFPQAVIDAVAEHHADTSFSSAESVLVYLADMISTYRPGAQYANYHEFVKRLKDLEKIVADFEGVDEAVVLQAGREIRAIVKPTQVDDKGVHTLALEIKERIRDHITYPGTISVTVSRETRAVEVAK